MNDFDSVLNAANMLSPDERQRLIELLQVDLPADSEVDEAWNAEIARRVAELDAGTVKTVSWDEIESDLLAVLGRHAAD